jgi:hypothetical protein
VCGASRQEDTTAVSNSHSPLESFVTTEVASKACGLRSVKMTAPSGESTWMAHHQGEADGQCDEVRPHQRSCSVSVWPLAPEHVDAGVARSSIGFAGKTSWRGCPSHDGVATTSSSIIRMYGASEFVQTRP